MKDESKWPNYTSIAYYIGVLSAQLFAIKQHLIMDKSKEGLHLLNETIKSLDENIIKEFYKYTIDNNLPENIEGNL